MEGRCPQRCHRRSCQLFPHRSCQHRTQENACNRHKNCSPDILFRNIGIGKTCRFHNGNGISVFCGQKFHKQQRDQKAVDAALAKLKAAAEGEENLMPYLIETVKTYATLGEICGVLREVFGEYKQSGSMF